MTTTTTAPHAPLLTAADILRGGDSGIRTATIEKYTKNGAPWTVHYKPIGTDKVIELMELQGDSNADKAASVQSMVGIVADALVTADGKPLISKEDLLKAPIDVVNALAAAMTETGDQGGKG